MPLPLPLQPRRRRVPILFPLILCAVVATAQPGFLASIADRVGGALFGAGAGGANNMGQGAGKPFGERAAAVVNKPLGCPTGWEREEKRETGTACLLDSERGAAGGDALGLLIQLNSTQQPLRT
jgi:hypothetical protein